MESVGVCCCLYGWQSDVSLQTVGTCTWSDSLVRCWLTTASDDRLRERLIACLNSSCLDVSLACLNWLEDSCDIVQHSTDTQLLLQVSDCFEQNISYWSCSMSSYVLAHVLKLIMIMIIEVYTVIIIMVLSSWLTTVRVSQVLFMEAYHIWHVSSHRSEISCRLTAILLVYSDQLTLLYFIDWASNGHQLTDLANRLGLWVRC